MLPDALAGDPVPAPADGLRALHLQPGAPRGLVSDVYDHLLRTLEAAAGGDAADGDIDALRATYDDARQSTCAAALETPEPAADVADADGVTLKQRSPLDLLFLRPDAPAEIVEVAYRYWRRRSAQLLSAEPETFDRADDRIAALARSPSPTRNGAAAVEPATASAWLVTDSGARYAVGERPLRIGVDPTCDIVTIANGARSADEARVWSHRGRHLLHGVSASGGGDSGTAGGGEDSGESVAVLVNGAAATWAVLDGGDVLEIGGLTFRFEEAEVQELPSSEADGASAP